MSETKQISYRIPTELYDTLQSSVESGGGKINDFCREVLLGWIEKNDDFSEVLREAYPERKILKLLTELREESAEVADVVLFKTKKMKYKNLREAISVCFESVDGQLDSIEKADRERFEKMDQRLEAFEKTSESIVSKLNGVEARDADFLEKVLNNGSLLRSVYGEVKRKGIDAWVEKHFWGLIVGFVLGCALNVMLMFAFRREETISHSAFVNLVDESVQRSVQKVLDMRLQKPNENQKNGGQKR